MKLEFNLDKDRLALAHIVLQDTDKAIEIAATPEWKEGNKLVACLTVNGVEIPAQIMEDWLQFQFESLCKKAKEQYDPENFDKRVEERAKELLKEHADNALEKLEQLQNILYNSEDLLTPHWERKSK